MIFSSRVVGTDTKTGSMPEAPAEQARLAFENVQTLLSGPERFVQPDSGERVRTRTRALGKVVEKAFAAISQRLRAPKLNILQVDLPAGATVPAGDHRRTPDHQSRNP